MDEILINKYRSNRLVPESKHGRWISGSGEAGVVSVVIPTYNREVYVIDALESVFAQDYRPIEVLVVDDSSTDDTEDVVRRWIELHAEERLFSAHYCKQVNSGAPAARNYGAIQSIGEFIQFLDSDDVLLPHKIGNAVALLRSGSADYVYCRAQFVDGQLNRLNDYFGQPETGTPDDVVTYLWQTMCPLFFREMLAEAGPWREGLINSQDWEYGARMPLLGFRAHYDSEVGAFFRIHHQGTMGSGELDVPKLFSIFSAYHSIGMLAQQLGVLGQVLKQRLFKRLLLTALQLGARDSWSDATRVLAAICELRLCRQPGRWLLQSFFRLKPGVCCRILEKKLLGNGSKG